MNNRKVQFDCDDEDLKWIIGYKDHHKCPTMGAALRRMIRQNRKRAFE